MRKSRLFLISLAAFAVPLLAAAQNVNPAALPVHDDGCLAVHESHDHHLAAHESAAAFHDHDSFTHAGLDQCALAEMHRFAADHFAGGHVRPESFGAVPHWGPDWELHWMDYEVAGKMMRIYHLTNTRHPEQRYLSVWDHSHDHYAEWQPAR